MGKSKRKFSKFLVAALAASFLVQPGTTVCAAGITPTDAVQFEVSDVSEEKKELEQEKSNEQQETLEEESSELSTADETTSEEESSAAEEITKEEESSAAEETTSEETFITEESTKDTPKEEESSKVEENSEEETSKTEETPEEKETSIIEEAPSEKETSKIEGTPKEEETSIIEENLIAEIASEDILQKTQKSEEREEVWFNTGRKAYQVVSKEDFFDKELGDAYFEEDGNYTIQIPEENPFFPYEVQFTYNGKVTNEWFLTPDDSIEIGEHTFYVSAYFDGTVVTQMSLEVAGDIVIVYPEEKEFIDENGAEALSLLPLEEKQLRVDLSSYTPVELTMVSLQSVFTGENELKDTDKVAYTSSGSDDFVIVNYNDKLNLLYSNLWQMIVGDADQLGKDNIRYIVRITKTDFTHWLIPTIYAQDNTGIRTNINVLESECYSYSSRLQTTISSDEVNGVEQIYIGLSVNKEIFPNTKYHSFKIYEGNYKSVLEAMKGTDITDKICNSNMEQKDSGYSILMNQDDCYFMFTIITFDEENQVTGYLPVKFFLYLYREYNRISQDNIYIETEDGRVNIVDYKTTVTKDGCEYMTSVLYKEYAANNVYYQKLYYYKDDVISSSDVTAAYCGQYASISEAKAANAEEISEDLFRKEGYAADYSQGVYFTIFVGEDGDQKQKIYKVCVQTETGTNSREFISWSDIYIEAEDGRVNIVDRKTAVMKDGCKYMTNVLYKEYAANNVYYQKLYYYKDDVISSSDVTVAYCGQYASISEAKAANAEEISEDLFQKEGYAADYSQGVYFTIFIGEDDDQKQKIYKVCVQTETGTNSHEQQSDDTINEILSDKTAVKFIGLKDQNGNSIPYYSVSNIEDSYSEFNFLTILVDEDVDLSNLAPVFWCERKLTLYTEGSTSPEISGESVHDFSKGFVQYTASAENGIASKNYWLQIIKPDKKERTLYINSLIDSNANTRIENNIIYSSREVFLDSYHNFEHDILLINMGFDVIPSLSVELVSDEMKLNDYWTLQGRHDLLGFNGISRTTGYGELDNLAKIRIEAKDEMKDGTQAFGKLIIKSGNTVLMELTLTGVIGDPCIITKEIPSAVKYVPYGTMIQNNNKYSWNHITYTIVEGELPEGMELKSNGELYGVPMKSGEFSITLRATNSSSEFSSSFAELKLIVNENTNANVYMASDEGYVIEKHIGTETDSYDYVLQEKEDQLFVSSGEYSEFVDLWLNGKKLIDGEDYTKDSGSTRITIRSQTFEKKADKNGINTIAAEFRVDGDGNKELKRTAQNFRLDLKNNNENPGNNNSGNNGSGGNSGSSGSSSSSGSSGSNGGSNSNANSNNSTSQNNINSTNNNPASTGYSDDSWIKDETGWWCKNPDGSWLADTWFQLPYKGTTGWYYFNDQGYMITGWLSKNGQWYYLNPVSDGTQGMMCTGWKLINGQWCYFDKEGSLVMNTWCEIPYMETTKWYYLNEQGYMASGWLSRNNKWYYLSPESDKTQGMMCTGWQLVGGKWYYLNPDGDLATDTWIGDYYVNSDGVWVE